MLNSSSQFSNAGDIMGKLSCIDQMLDEVPELQQNDQHDIAESARSARSAEIPHSLPDNVDSTAAAKCSSDETGMSNLKQSCPPGLQPIAVPHAVVPDTWDAAASKVCRQPPSLMDGVHSSMPDDVEQKCILLKQQNQQSAQHNGLQSPGPELDAIASQMDAHSAELLHHVSIAMSQLPAARATTVSAPAIQAMPAQYTSSPVQTHNYVQNPLFVNLAGQSQPATQPEVPASFADLISRIRLTEYRLQEAITSLTDATHRFKQEIPQHSVREPFSQQVNQPHFLKPSHAVPNSSSSSPAQLLHMGYNSDPEGSMIASPLRSLQWTQLNPLCRASSHSVSPDSQMPSRAASRALSPVPAATNSTCASAVPGQSVTRHLVSEDDGQFCAVPLHHETAVRHRQYKTPSPDAHDSHAAPLGWSDVGKAETAQRQSAVDSMVSMSSAWSLEQPLLEDQRILNRSINSMRGSVIPSMQHMQHHGIRNFYAAPFTVGQNEPMDAQGCRTSRPLAASAGHAARRSYHLEEGSGEGGLLPESASFPGWSSAEPGVCLNSRTAARSVGAFNFDCAADATPTTWLQERNSQRVSYYEGTIFTLRQAGIHVEPHWFGPVTCEPSILWY